MSQEAILQLTVIYITSQGHSGSTLLTLLLGGHPDIFAIGEVNAFSEERRIARFKKYQKKMALIPHDKRREYESHLEKSCMCGAEAIKVCPVWSRVDRYLREHFDLSLDQLDVNNADNDVFRRHNLALFQAAAAVANVNFVIDATKEMSRMKRLQCLDELDVRPIHLRRSAHGYVYSGVKRNLPWWKYVRSYVIREIERTLFLSRQDHFFVQYESLATQTQTIIADIMKWLELPFHSNQLKWSGSKQHLIAGNHMRFNSAAIIRIDEKWRKALPNTLKQLISFITWPVVGKKNGHHPIKE